MFLVSASADSKENVMELVVSAIGFHSSVSGSEAEVTVILRSAYADLPLSLTLAALTASGSSISVAYIRTV